MKNLAPVLSIIALLVAIFALFKGTQNEASPAVAASEEKHEPHGHEEIELAQYMSTLQTHFAKLYFAGKANNQKLAAFYAHEMEESFETIVNANVFEDGQNISTLAEQFGLSPIQRLEKEISEKGIIDFESKYNNIMLNCNSCHLKTAHEFIQIVIPENPPVGNQKFTPAGQ